MFYPAAWLQYLLTLSHLPLGCQTSPSTTDLVSQYPTSWGSLRVLYYLVQRSSPKEDHLLPSSQGFPWGLGNGGEIKGPWQSGAFRKKSINSSAFHNLPTYLSSHLPRGTSGSFQTPTPSVFLQALTLCTPWMLTLILQNTWPSQITLFSKQHQSSVMLPQ